MSQSENDGISRTNLVILIGEFNALITKSFQEDIMEANRYVFANTNFPERGPQGDKVNFERMAIYTKAMITQLKKIKGRT